MIIEACWQDYLSPWAKTSHLAAPIARIPPTKLTIITLPAEQNTTIRHAVDRRALPGKQCTGYLWASLRFAIKAKL